MHRREVIAVTLLALGVIAFACSSAHAQAQQRSPNQKAAKQTAASAQGSSPATPQPPQGKAFTSPEEAAAALYSAAQDNNDTQLLAILGPNAQAMITWGDNAADRQADRSVFAQKYNQMHRLVQEADGTIALYVGPENWPLPIPLVQINGQWYFDAGLGEKEILFRRVGENESEAINVCRALADAEKEYFDEAHAYTSQLVSHVGTHDGLYSDDPTPADPNLIGPYLAHAAYRQPGDTSSVPFHGYYYRILTSQGADAPGGAKSYLVNGKMAGGFAILAFPAEYRSSGVMTFMVSQDGVAYQKDLGPMTDKLAKQMSTFNPDATWQKTE